MEEATGDKKPRPTSESKKSKPKTHGWIRMHQEETTKPHPADEQLEGESIT